MCIYKSLDTWRCLAAVRCVAVWSCSTARSSGSHCQWSWCDLAMGLIELQAIAIFHFQHWLYPFSWSCKWKCKCKCHINQVVNVNVVGLHIHPSADASCIGYMHTGQHGVQPWRLPRRVCNKCWSHACHTPYKLCWFNHILLPQWTLTDTHWYCACLSLCTAQLPCGCVTVGVLLWLLFHLHT